MSQAPYLFLARPAHVTPVFGSVPTRDELCSVRMRFQGMSIDLPAGSTYDPLKARYWWDPLMTGFGAGPTDAGMPSQADRMAVYAAHRNVKPIPDTHLNLSLDLGGLRTLPRVLDVAQEAVTLGGMTAIVLMCMGDGSRTDPDPGALGYDWLMANFQAIYQAARAINTGDPNNSLAHRLIFVPGYDGVVPGWQPPSSVDRFLLMARSVIDYGKAGALGLELSSGYCKWGTDDGIERNNWATLAGKAVDVIFQEGPIDQKPPEPFPPPAVWERMTNQEKAPWTQVYQMIDRMVRPYYPLPGQPDDPNPPYLLAGGTPRGEFYYDYLEYDTMSWTGPWRHGTRPYPIEKIAQHRAVAYQMGGLWVG